MVTRHQTDKPDIGMRSTASLPEAIDCVAEVVADVDFDPVFAVCNACAEAVVGTSVVDFRPTPPGPNETDECPVPIFVVILGALGPMR